MVNPCVSCGVCCALYKVVIEPDETTDQPGGVVPVELTVTSRNKRRFMKGTETFRKRCMALTGTVGANVGCSIYEQRPMACRRFAASWEAVDGGNPLCNRARVMHGLPPFGDY